MCWKVEQDEKSLKEVFQYPDMTFPFFVWPDLYNLFFDHMVDAHWHYDFEFSYVASGALDYYINDTYLRLGPGDCVFVNSNMLHLIRQPDDCDSAIVLTMAFPTTLLAPDSSSTLYEKYFQPIIGNQLEGFKISSGHPLGQEMAALMDELLGIVYPAFILTSDTVSAPYKRYHQQLLDNHLDNLATDSGNKISPDAVARIRKNAEEGLAFGYELECMKRVIQFILLTIKYIEGNNSGLFWRTGSLASIERARGVLAYMHANFHKKITVEDLAKDLGISRSECFRCFKRFTGKKPIEYLNDYRMLKAAQLIRETETSITGISERCGFESASYFSKVFKEKYSVTPLQYRRLG